MADGPAEEAAKHIHVIKREVCRYAVAEYGHGAHKPKFAPPDKRARQQAEAATVGAFEGAARADLLDWALNFFASASSLVPPPYDEDREQQQMWARMSAEKRTEARLGWALFEAEKQMRGGEAHGQ